MVIYCTWYELLYDTAEKLNKHIIVALIQDLFIDELIPIAAVRLIS